MTSSADAVLPILADDVDPAARMETMSSPQQQTVVPRMENEGLSELFGMYVSGAKHNGEKLTDSFLRVSSNVLWIQALS